MARELLGQTLVVARAGRRVAGRIVEVEAYLGVDDPASHAWDGRRDLRNANLYGPPGSWYVYLSYGVHWCANLVTGPAGRGAAVLLRALEPLEGLRAMERRRGTTEPRLLCGGPGRLTEALGITQALDGLPITGPGAWLEPGESLPETAVAVTRRIGITRAADWPLRFVMRGSPFVSGPAALRPR